MLRSQKKQFYFSYKKYIYLLIVVIFELSPSLAISSYIPNTSSKSIRHSYTRPDIIIPIYNGERVLKAGFGTLLYAPKEFAKHTYITALLNDFLASNPEFHLNKINLLFQFYMPGLGAGENDDNNIPFVKSAHIDMKKFLDKYGSNPANKARMYNNLICQFWGAGEPITNSSRNINDWGHTVMEISLSGYWANDDDVVWYIDHYMREPYSGETMHIYSLDPKSMEVLGVVTNFKTIDIKNAQIYGSGFDLQYGVIKDFGKKITWRNGSKWRKISKSINEIKFSDGSSYKKSKPIKLDKPQRSHSRLDGQWNDSNGEVINIKTLTSFDLRDIIYVQYVKGDKTFKGEYNAESKSISLQSYDEKIKGKVLGETMIKLDNGIEWVKS